jgi:ABC-type sugar transport system ATPase subunit
VRYHGAPAAAVDAISLTVGRSRTLAIVGPSGAGKTSLLRALAGLERARGSIEVDGLRVEHLPPQQRRIAMLFAKDSLPDHRTVRETIAFAMRSRDRDRVGALARTLDIERHLERKPRQLSTGERQRVAIARAVLADPAVLLLDEPLAALDPELRARVREELLAVQTHFSGPMILVTHDHVDAMTVADELAVLIEGRLEDIGDPQRVYDAPATLRAATFLGVRPMNALDGRALGEAPGVIVGIRPEFLRFDAGGALSGVVERIERTGADAYVAVSTNAGNVLVRVDPHDAPARASVVTVGWDARNARRFDRASGNAIA